MKSGVSTQKLRKDSGKLQFGSLRPPRFALQQPRDCLFLPRTVLGWGAQFLFGGAQAVIWGGGTAQECPPWCRAWPGNTKVYATLP